jgi:hypothetical protein
MRRKNRSIRSVATHPKGEDQVAQKIVADPGAKLEKLAVNCRI